MSSRAALVIASGARQSRLDLSSPAQQFCHREGRSDLACHPFLSKHPMGITRNNSVIASAARQSRLSSFPVRAPDGCGERSVAISVFLLNQTDKSEIASQARLYLSSRGTKRSRLSGAGRTRKERLPRCARNDRLDAGSQHPQGALTRQKNVAISVVIVSN